MLDAAACGVPQLLLPMQSIDQHANAALLDGRGVAIGLTPDRQTPDSVHDALARLLTG